MKIGHYRAYEEIGRGGRGVVLRAEDATLGRVIALKLVAPGPGRTAEEEAIRLRRSAEAAAEVSHPGACSTFEIGVADGYAFAAMPYIAGQTLADWCAERFRSGALHSASHQDAAAVVERAAKVIARAHSRGVVHGDLKPANLMMAPDGTVTVLDFGGSDIDGTPLYASPERIASATTSLAPATKASDVYALGATLFELCTGQPPHNAPTRATLEQAILRSPAPSLRMVDSTAPRDLAAVVDRALSPELSRRYPDAEALREDLARFREGRQTRARPVGTWRRGWRLARRHPAAAGVISLLLLALGAALLFEALRNRELRTLNDEAVTAHANAVRATEEARAHTAARLRLSDRLAVEELEARASELWPASPELSELRAAWLRDARAVAHRKPEHSAARLALANRARSDATSRDGAAPNFEDPEDRFRHDELVALIASLESLASRTIPDVELRDALAADWTRRSTDDAGHWAAMSTRLSADVRFANLAIGPLAGLSPLGPDPVSGLEEFAHIQTGEVPRRGADGALVLSGESAVVLVLVPGGTFTMGSSEGEGSPEERPAFPVRVDPYFIGKREVSWGEWRRILAAGGLEPHANAERQDDLMPARRISHDEAREALRRLGLALPNEIQWERAARGDTKTAWWSGSEASSLGAVANVRDQSLAQALRAAQAPESPCEPFDDGFVQHAPCGALRPNAYGLHDVHGNVWEWCRNSLLPYPLLDLEDAGSASEVEERVARGGCFAALAFDARAARRIALPVTTRTDLVGVRVSRPAR